MSTPPATRLDLLLQEVRACRLCEAMLPLGPRPILRATVESRLLIIGQAPGTKVHASGIPWRDASGDRLRGWLDLSPDIFYDEGQVAILPAGLCYPGRDPKGGDLPPRPECAPLWHPRIRPLLTNIQLTLLVGSYAQKLALPSAKPDSMTETVRRWRDFLPDVIPLPHPSWRTGHWERQNPWFGEEILPATRTLIAKALGKG